MNAGARRVAALMLGAVAALGASLQPERALAKPAIVATGKPAPRPDAAAFHAFIEALWPEARAKGVSRATFDAAFKGVELDPSVLAHTKTQSEFEQSIRAYLASAVSVRRIATGRGLVAQWADDLATVERRFGVDRALIVALWGLESGYGAGIGGKDIIAALASLAYSGFRAPLFRDELLTVLVILEQGHVSRAEMRGSWAGAMGQPQFMPSSFVKYAVALDGGARKDIWTNTPDVLASIANFMKASGWRSGLPWGFEVAVPKGFDYAAARASFADFARRGVTRADGKPMPGAGEALLFFPVGWRGPAFLITDNFFVIKAYNTSDSYALSAGLLADGIASGEGIHARWSATIDGLNRAQRLEAQTLLTRLRLYDGRIDGHLGPAMREAVRRFQAAHGLIADGFPTPALLAKLRAAR